MKHLSFTLKGEPRGKGAPRAYTQKMGQKYVARIRKDPKTKLRENSITKELSLQFPDTRIDGPVKLTVTFVMPVPKSYKGWRQQLAWLGGYFHTKKPDVSNMIKLVEDAITKSNVWTDDALVVEIRAKKRYAMEDEESATYVTITELPQATKTDAT